MTLDLVHAGASNAKDVTGHVEISLAGQKLGAKVHVDADGVGSLDLDAPKVALGSRDVLQHRRVEAGVGQPSTSTCTATWRRRWRSSRPTISRSASARGTVHVKAHLARDDAEDFTPDLSLSVTTDQLELAAKTPQWTRHRRRPGRSAAGVAHRGRRLRPGRARRRQQRRGEAVHAAPRRQGRPRDDRPDRPACSLRRGPPRRRRAFERVRATAFDVHVAIPERGLGTVPPILRQSYVTGKLQADVKASGTMMAPKLDVTASLRRAAYTGNGPRAQPLDVDLAGHYEGANGSASIKAHSGDRELLDLEAQVQARLEQLLGSGESSAPLAWKASAHARPHRVPDGVHRRARRPAREGPGERRALGGRPARERPRRRRALHRRAQRREHRLQVGEPPAERRREGRGRRVESTRPTASWRRRRTRRRPGATRSRRRSTMARRSTSISSSKNFRIAVLLPFVGGMLDELDGRVDAQTHVQLDPTKNTAQASGLSR